MCTSADDLFFMSMLVEAVTPRRVWIHVCPDDMLDEVLLCALAALMLSKPYGNGRESIDVGSVFSVHKFIFVPREQSSDVSGNLFRAARCLVLHAACSTHTSSGHDLNWHQQVIGTLS